MTSLWKWAQAGAMAALMVLYAPAAFAQATTAAAPAHNHQEMMARIAALDARIDMMVADVNMFTGELKTAAIASLLTAIVERDKATRETMMQMHEQMMQKMMPPKAEAAGGEEIPGGMCGAMMKHEATAPHP
jgi:hypothetical protein